jgi:conjugal transfer pilus assembly protein TraK
MKRTCRPLALLLIIGAPLSAEELPANALPMLSPVTSNTLETMPLADIPGTVPAPDPLQVELPPVDANVLKAATSQATTSTHSGRH